MSNTVRFKIDAHIINAVQGQTILEAAQAAGIYIPTLCNFKGAKPKGCCRICSIKINNRYMTACTTPAADGMEIENDIAELADMRKSIIELLFVSGNHFCPSCEKSGNCELQALAYRNQMMVPRFPFLFPQKGMDTSLKILKDQNRCILCKRCIKTIKDEKGRSYFALKNRGTKLEIVLDHEMGQHISDDLAKKAMENCPVGSIIYKEQGFREPIGTRKYDKTPIGNEIDV